MEHNSPESICKSIFKNGEKTTTQEMFTEKWIELINALENKRI